MDRRRFVSALAGASAVALSGCTASVADPRTWTTDPPEPGDAAWTPEEPPEFTGEWPPGMGPSGVTDWRRFLHYHDVAVDGDRYVASTSRFRYIDLALEEDEDGRRLVEEETTYDETMRTAADVGADRFYAAYDSGSQELYGARGRVHNRRGDEVSSFDQRDPTARAGLSGYHPNAFVSVRWDDGTRTDDGDRFRFTGGEPNRDVDEDVLDRLFYSRIDSDEVGRNEATLELDADGLLRTFEATWDYGGGRRGPRRFSIVVEVESYDAPDVVARRLPDGRPDWVVRSAPWK